MNKTPCEEKLERQEGRIAKLETAMLATIDYLRELHAETDLGSDILARLEAGVARSAKIEELTVMAETLSEAE